jgi:hypothetical protein
MELNQAEIDTIVADIANGKLRTKATNVFDARFQAFLRRPAAGQQADNVESRQICNDDQEQFMDALLSFTNTTSSIGAKAQVHTALSLFGRSP